MSGWQPSAGIDALRLRAALNAAIRKFFSDRGVLEVETPVLSMAGNTEPNIASFSLEFTGRTEVDAISAFARDADCLGVQLASQFRIDRQ